MKNKFFCFVTRYVRTGDTDDTRNSPSDDVALDNGGAPPLDDADAALPLDDDGTFNVAPYGDGDGVPGGDNNAKEKK